MPQVTVLCADGGFEGRMGEGEGGANQTLVGLCLY